MSAQYFQLWWDLEYCEYQRGRGENGLGSRSVNRSAYLARGR